MNAKIIPPIPEAFALDRQVITDGLEVHIACPDKEKYDKVAIFYIVAIRMVEDMAGKEVTDFEWEIIKDDIRTDFIFPSESFGNGIYEVLIQAYIRDGDETIFSGKNIYTVTIFRKKIYNSTVIDDCGYQLISVYDHIYGDESASMYVNNILLSHHTGPEKGYLLEANICRSGGESYHKARLRHIAGDVPARETYEAIFPLDADGIEVPGNKRALFFVPIEREVEPFFEMDAAEYSDPECMNLIEEKSLLLGLEDFSSWFYLDFTRKSPKILMTVAREKIGRAHVNIRAENFSPDVHCMHLTIEEESQGKIFSGHIEEAYHKVDLLTPGNYKVKVVLTNISGKRTFDRKEADVEVLEELKPIFYHEKSISCGKQLDVKIKLPQAKQIREYELEISGYEADIKCEKRGDIIFAKIEISPSIPSGLHLLHFEGVSKDNISIKGTSPVIIKDKKS